MAFQKIAEDAAKLERRVAERTAQLQEINQEISLRLSGFPLAWSCWCATTRGFADALLENKDSANDPDRGAFLGRIIAAARDMDHMIQDLLDYSRVSRQEILSRAVNLDQVVREAAEQLQLETKELETKESGFHLRWPEPCRRSGAIMRCWCR